MDQLDDVDNFGSVAWDTTPSSHPSTEPIQPILDLHTPTSTHPFEDEPVSVIAQAREQGNPAWDQSIHSVEVKDALKELEGTKDMFVSYLVTAHVSSSISFLTST